MLQCPTIAAGAVARVRHGAVRDGISRRRPVDIRRGNRRPWRSGPPFRRSRLTDKSRSSGGRTRVRSSCRARPQFMDPDGLHKALRPDLIDASEDERGLRPHLDGFTHQHLRTVILVQSLETGGEIDRGAERRVVHAVGGADVADHGLADMKAEPRSVGRPILLRELPVQLPRSFSGIRARRGKRGLRDPGRRPAHSRTPSRRRR